MNRTKFFVVLGFAVLAGVGSGIAEAAIVGYARPGVITAVSDIDTPGADSVLYNGGLANGVLGFVDRTEQRWDTIPIELLGADYIQSAQDNADATEDDPDGAETLAIDVKVVAGTILHMFIDSRFGPGVVPFSWMTSALFGSDWIDSGKTVNGVNLHPSGIGDIEFQVWSTAIPLNAGTYRFRQQPTDGSFYGIAATSVVPEPATLPLFSLALAVFVAHRSIKRNRRQQR